MIALQAEAKAVGANAVVDIVSDYGDEYSDPEKYECHVGFLMSGVIMKREVGEGAAVERLASPFAERFKAVIPA